MEVNLKEPIHIEFFGLPGCGKSTISHLVAEKLRDKGYRVYEPTYYSDHNLKPVCRKLHKLLATLYYSISHHKEYLALIRLAKQNGYTGFKDSLKQIVNIVTKVKHYQNNESAVYFWDEGLCQSAISLAMNSSVDAREVERELITIAGQRKIVKVYLKTDIETALMRMAGRSSNDSRVEQESDANKKHEIMRRFEDCCERIGHDSEILNCYECSVEILCETISNRLFELI